MNQGPSFPGAPLPPEFPSWQLVPPSSNSFWQSEDVHGHERKLQEIIDLAKAMQEELEQISLIKRGIQHDTEGDPSAFDNPSETQPPSSSNRTNNSCVSQSFEDGLTMRVAEIIKAKKISLDAQESLSIDAANSLALSLRNQLAPFTALTNEGGSWMERSVLVKLSEKLQKSKRNKHWRKRKRRHVAELLRKERENFEKADHDADEWRTREIAKDIAQRKVENMKKIAKLKADEERKRLESELELVLIVEKLQELRSIRIQKLKKQGHFLPEEDDKFLERVRAAVEEEERQAAAAADTDAAKDAIATAEESRKAIRSSIAEANVASQTEVESPRNQGQEIKEQEISLGMKTEILSQKQMAEARGSSGVFDSSTNLPFEFFHYYHGSSNDMGTLIEVRRMWDAYIRPGGSRIPGHWVQPPPPADDVWASYLVRPN